MAATAARATLLVALLVPVMAMGAGVGGLVTASKGFRAGKYYNRTATIASLGTAELKYASKADNIDGLLALLRTERRAQLDTISELQAWEKYNGIPDGDRLLLICAKDPSCEPLPCVDIARLSELHREVMLRRPGSNLAQANQKVGAVSEQVMVRHFESSGWQRIEGQIGRNGIDGLFEKRNGEGVVREVLVVESKYNTSTLKPTNFGQQMSRDWVEKKLLHLRERQPDDATYRQVEKLIVGGYYRARLWTMRVDSGELRIELLRVRSASDKVDNLIEDPGTRVLVPPEVIRLSAPRDSFEKTIVAAYKEELANLGAWR
ncbi:MAG: hypothetical protein IPG93_10120 [Burkholderiales bacterium]|nr:hypothetical protein [Burkholderiales bacterium]